MYLKNSLALETGELVRIIRYANDYLALIIFLDGKLNAVILDKTLECYEVPENLHCFSLGKDYTFNFDPLGKVEYLNLTDKPAFFLHITGRYLYLPHGKKGSFLSRYPAFYNIDTRESMDFAPRDLERAFAICEWNITLPGGQTCFSFPK